MSPPTHATIQVPIPGNMKLNNPETIATGYETYGTFDISSHTYLSTSSITITLLLIWSFNLSFAYA